MLNEANLLQFIIAVLRGSIFVCFSLRKDHSFILIFSTYSDLQYIANIIPIKLDLILKDLYMLSYLFFFSVVKIEF